MTVLEILNEFPGETFIREHVNALHSFYPDLDLHLGFTHTDKIGRFSSKLSLPTYSIPNFNRVNRFKKIPYILKYGKADYKRKSLNSLISKINPDRIHYHFSSTAIKWHSQIDSNKSQMSFSIRGTDVQVAPYIIKGRTDELRKISDEAFQIHAVCEDLKQELIQLHPDIDKNKIKVIRTGIGNFWFEKDLNTIQKPNNKIHMLSVGRLHWRKGFDDLIIACKIIKDKGLDFKLTIIGEGDERAKLEFLIHHFGLTEQIELKGKMSQRDFISLVDKMDIAVQSSLMEGFPNSVAEMMALGVPIVCTNVNGVSEILDENNSKDYTISKPGDPESLVNAILKQIDNNDNKKIRSKRLRELAKNHFTQELHATAFYKFLYNN